MITTLVALFALQGEVKPELPAPGKIVSDVLAKYAAATSVVGRVTMTQTADSSKFSIETNFQHERPNKVCIDQKVISAPKSYEGYGNWLTVSNGVSFAYDTPDYFALKKMGAKRERLTEPIATRSTTTGEPKILKLNDILRASKRSLGDYLNPYLQFIYQGEEDNACLKDFVSRISKMKTSSIRKLADGTEVYVVTGLFQYGVPPETDPNSDLARSRMGESYSFARFEMLVDKEMNMRKFQTVESIAVVPEGTNVPVQTNIVSVWSGEVLLNTKPVEALFQLR
jgi:hypothetical protein